jgi:hypothetical protein
VGCRQAAGVNTRRRWVSIPGCGSEDGVDDAVDGLHVDGQNSSRVGLRTSTESAINDRSSAHLAPRRLRNRRRPAVQAKYRASCAPSNAGEQAVHRWSGRHPPPRSPSADHAICRLLENAALRRLPDKHGQFQRPALELLQHARKKAPARTSIGQLNPGSDS